jgi:hypothetical protein
LLTALVGVTPLNNKSIRFCGYKLLVQSHSNFYEVRISKIDPVVTRAPPGMQNMSMSKNMAKMST